MCGINCGAARLAIFIIAIEYHQDTLNTVPLINVICLCDVTCIVQFVLNLEVNRKNLQSAMSTGKLIIDL